MLEPLVLAAVLATAAAPTPSPAPSSASQPLTEIGHVTSSAICTSIVVRANSAIGAALRNDQTVSLAVDTLRHVNLDTSNVIERQKGMNAIERLAEELRQSSGDADAQIKKLRDLAAKSDDPVRKEELKEFADALGGALQRQRRIGADLQRMLVIMDGRQARLEAQRDVMYSNPGVIAPGAAWNDTFSTQHFNAIALAAAQEVENRTLSIAADESKAADHVVGAVSGC